MDLQAELSKYDTVDLMYEVSRRQGECEHMWVNSDMVFIQEERGYISTEQICKKCDKASTIRVPVDWLNKLLTKCER